MSESSAAKPTLVRLVLSFNLCETFGDPPVWCFLQRDGVRLFFKQPPASTFPPDWSGHVPATGHAPHAELSARKLAPMRMRVTHYGMKEFELRDPDGYCLWFGEDTDEALTSD